MPPIPSDAATPHRPGTAPLALALVALLALGGCRRDDDGGAPTDAGAEREVPLEVLRARERIAALWANDDTTAIRAELEPLIAIDRPAARDLLSAALVERRLGDFEASRALLERAREIDPSDPATHFNLGLLAKQDGDFARASEHLAVAYELAPDDVSAQLALGEVLEESDPERVLDMYLSIRERGFDAVGGLYLTVLYRLCQFADDEALRNAACDEFAELNAQGFSIPKIEDGPLGSIAAPTPRAPAGGKRTEPGPIPAFEAPQRYFPELAGATGMLLVDLDNDGEIDVLAWGPFGLRAGVRPASGDYVVDLTDEEPDHVLALDLANDDDLDVIVAVGNELRALRAELFQEEDDGPLRVRWSAPVVCAELPDAPAHMVAVDYDHDGDLDLVACGSFGARVLRNDGYQGYPSEDGAGGALVDATATADLPTDRAFTWIVTEDFDTDQDVDLLLGGPRELYLASSLRGGVFEDQSARLAGLEPSRLPYLVADLNADGRPDLVRVALDDDGDELSATVALLLPSGAYEPLAAGPATCAAPGPGALSLALVDLDLDAALDLLATSAGGTALTGIQSIGLDAAAPFALELPGEPQAPTAPVAVVDLDGDLAWEAVQPTGEGIAVHEARPSQGTPLLLALRGVKDNRRGLGAIVELRNGAHYMRIYWRGRTELVGLGPGCDLDWLRITWPNGVVQYDPRLDCGDRRVTADAFAFLQSDGLVGSCPFLYTWNGETFEFITDVLGITPLGLPMEPGVLVPPDHDEYVLVRGEQMVPRDGFLELQFTEELREVTYLDRVRLDVVDHPADTEIFPNERFQFPPFPEPHVHTVRGSLAPTRARDQDGVDWTAALSVTDDTYAAPFERAPSQYRGIATPHTLELAFDPAAVRDAPRLRLVMTGWFRWSNASVNVAVARDPAWSFVPPILSVPDPDVPDGWRATGPPLGFPAGKTKTMVVDVTDLLVRDDPRLRLTSTLELYWDSIRLAVCADDAELRIASLEPASARHWRRGFSANEESAAPHQPERFTWDRLAPFPRWDPHPGLYTKFGEALPLVTAVDDRYVVMGTGEALHLRFDARDLPPVPDGFRRDYLVFLDGWAKDRDPNTVAALYVEPLPFHGMSAYPYGPDEAFPSTPAHEAWRREWLVRPPEPWLHERASAVPVPGRP